MESFSRRHNPETAHLKPCVENRGNGATIPGNMSTRKKEDYRETEAEAKETMRKTQLQLGSSHLPH